MDCANIIEKVKPSVAFIVAINEQGRPTGATGSGFIYPSKNILVTCNHVVKGAAGTVIKFPDSTDYIPAKTILRDDEHDLALLSFEDTAREPLECGDLENIMEGMQVVFSGYPLSLNELTTHQGIISAIIKDETGITSYRIDGTVNPGNSGCPLLNSEGKLIGVINATTRIGMDILDKVQNMSTGALSLHGVDLVQIYKVLTDNLQLGIGYAVPAEYIPEHKVINKQLVKKNK